MAVKKRSKISAEFNMSSLTDIIFLLLIFFMLTSNAVQISVQLPKSDSTAVAPTNLPITMLVDGTITIAGKASSVSNMEKDVALAVRETDNKENATLTIISEVGVPWENVHKAMAIASGLKIKAIIATQPSHKN
ncbi:MAG: biopolymer transporter ExbD [Saprospiraceae bacterium]|jgi:biopolymer transport protein ExbD|nr:biopolymer transporter ExbD [Saprospiraceae bacterium]MBK9566596.1 biopolymer transporter ExbD [Saprospiraceae bacterium]MBP6445594.1 biopolymer transporter ExbD [Saprospiraceae bacterium]